MTEVGVRKETLAGERTKRTSETYKTNKSRCAGLETGNRKEVGFASEILAWVRTKRTLRPVQDGEKSTEQQSRHSGI